MSIICFFTDLLLYHTFARALPPDISQQRNFTHAAQCVGVGIKPKPASTLDGVCPERLAFVLNRGALEIQAYS